MASIVGGCSCVEMGLWQTHRHDCRGRQGVVGGSPVVAQHREEQFQVISHEQCLQRQPGTGACSRCDSGATRNPWLRRSRVVAARDLTRWRILVQGSYLASRATPPRCSHRASPGSPDSFGKSRGDAPWSASAPGSHAPHHDRQSPELLFNSRPSLGGLRTKCDATRSHTMTRAHDGTLPRQLAPTETRGRYIHRGPRPFPRRLVSRI